ncbi:hemolysin III family protein [Phycicoccus endophyticus]|uniref:Hemolysin III family protein n=1 Tax=Phycicoccus endophyticus TaxID=1690220 RepID=A0A7G9R2J8_9MICO|nr:hemolysin III family protein [Phycicoccus endophyticus]NHI20719.1 hemolysin III family protein [Phycicoccus endophyticus]QNN49823.1 hemolysin III family protein [Phycicoccus endophyticus]GGL35423.1 DNA-binding protein [Phycicoccus endophyticus]
MDANPARPTPEQGRLEALETRVEAALQQVKPKLRGWLHAAMTPVALVAGVVLVVLATTTQGKVSAAVFAGTAVLLFGTSAVYHRGTWSPRVGGVLRRLDHSNIFLIIAGSYTPFALFLPSGQARTLLAVVWGGALVGVLFRVLWTGAPRWLYVPVYLLLGWVAVFYFAPLVEHVGAGVMTWVVVGGVLYSLGAIVYGTKRPDISPRWFGFHEVFHALTILAFTAHFVAASLALTGHTA